MEDLSEKGLRERCPHCDPTSLAFAYPLGETAGFHLLCDAHPLVKGHVMLISKRHLSCVGEYPPALLAEFEVLYERCLAFVGDHFGPPAAFEHGVLGQTVFHSHVHVLPFDGGMRDLVPEGESHYEELATLAALSELYRDRGGYLFAAVQGTMWTVDPGLAVPRFFRDRFARALGRPERGNWKQAHDDEQLMRAGENENRDVQALWRKEEPSRTS